MTRKEMVSRTLIYWPLNHLTQLVAFRYFIEIQKSSNCQMKLQSIFGSGAIEVLFILGYGFASEKCEEL
jgi:hypothetical protein